MRTTVHGILAGLTALAFGLTAAAAEGDQADLAKKALAVLKTNCYRCHGDNGAAEGGFNYVIDRQRLLERKKIVPKESANSKIYKRISAGEMPPEDEKIRPSAADLAVVKQWIDAGAPDSSAVVVKREFISPQDMLLAMRDDLRKVPPREHRFIRYFTLTHLYNTDLSEDELQTYRNGLSKLVNSLSWGRAIVVPRPVDKARTIFRIDLRDYQWNEKIWHSVVGASPYNVLYTSEAAELLGSQTQTKMPYVRGDWFVAAASRPPLYHAVLQLPRTDLELEKLLRVDVATDIREERVARAGFNGSGVSRNNRLVERHSSGYGAYWKSYDFAGNVGHENLFEYPLGPGGNNGFKQSGGEIIFNLPNGLQAYLLVDANGKRIDKGPTTIVSDPRQADRAVVNGVSCMSCHFKGMIEKADQIRAHVVSNRQAFNQVQRDRVMAMYPVKDKFLALLKEDADRFKQAVEKTGTTLTTTDPVVLLALRFEAEMDLGLTAAECGLKPPEFIALINRAPALARVFGPLKVKGGTIQRQVFVTGYRDIVRELGLGTFLERLVVEAQVHEFAEEGKKTTVLCLSGDGRLALLGGADGSLRLRNLETGRQVFKVVHPRAKNAVEDAPIICLAVSADGKRALSASGHHTILHWDLESGKELSRLESHHGPVHCLAFAPNGKLAVFGGKPGPAPNDQGLWQWGLETNKDVVPLPVNESVNCAAFAPDGNHVLVGGDASLRLVDLKLKKEIRRYGGHTGPIRCATFARDGKQCLSGSNDGTVRLWNVERGQEVRCFDRHKGVVDAVAFSPDGSRIVAGRRNRTAQLMDAHTGADVNLFPDQTAAIFGLVFQPDGQHILCGTGDSVVRQWEAPH
jgi:mono/diheme cytochrome c family protein